MPGPFGFPWSTFAAAIVIAASVVIAVVFALKATGKEDRDE